MTTEQSKLLLWTTYQLIFAFANRDVVFGLVSKGYNKWLQSVKEKEFLIERRVLNYVPGSKEDGLDGVPASVVDADPAHNNDGDDDDEEDANEDEEGDGVVPPDPETPSNGSDFEVEYDWSDDEEDPQAVHAARRADQIAEEWEEAAALAGAAGSDDEDEE